MLIQISLSGLLIDDSTHSLALEDFFATLGVFLNELGAVLSHTRRLLFEINVDSNRLDIVQGVVLIEGQTEITVVIHARCLGVLLGSLRIVLPRAHVN